MFSHNKPYISKTDLDNGIVFRNYDLLSGDFTGCTFLVLDEVGLTKFSIDQNGEEKLERLVREESEKSVSKIFDKEIYKLNKDPLRRQRRIRVSYKKKR
jgi:hypothetical protein